MLIKVGIEDRLADPGGSPTDGPSAVIPAARRPSMVTRRSEMGPNCWRAFTLNVTPIRDYTIARRFFEHWRASLKWQRLTPYEKFAAMIDRHWDGIAAYSRPENKISLGFVEGLNNKIRVIQRRAYGLRNEEYLRLKILTCMLPAL